MGFSPPLHPTTIGSLRSAPQSATTTQPATPPPSAAPKEFVYDDTGRMSQVKQNAVVQLRPRKKGLVHFSVSACRLRGRVGRTPAKHWVLALTMLWRALESEPDPFLKSCGATCASRVEEFREIACKELRSACLRQVGPKQDQEDGK